MKYNVCQQCGDKLLSEQSTLDGFCLGCHMAKCKDKSCQRCHKAVTALVSWAQIPEPEDN